MKANPVPKYCHYDVTEHGVEFDFIGGRWDVGKAKEVINTRKRRRKPEMVEIAGMKKLLGLVGTGERPDAEIDLDVPIILAPMDVEGKKYYIPIDGWHRIKKAVKQGLRKLPACILSDKEGVKVRVR